MFIENINSPIDLKKIPIENLSCLANEIRDVLIKKASLYGGHLGSNLCVVELTIALHYVFNSPVDKIIFDVSHQCYTHKILTGRKNAYISEAEYDSVSGFTNPIESVHDHFNIGHTSTSISLACGFAKARDLQFGNENIVAVIGDASLDGGEAFEALNFAGELNSGIIIVVNDNNMSIPENHGALNKLLNDLRENNGIVKDNYFKSIGFDYVFVKDGHSISKLIEVFSSVKDTKHPVVIHCCTQKGKGYVFAEKDREKWHHAHPFNIATGEFIKLSTVPKENYGSIVGEYLIDRMKKDAKIVAMTASVPACFGFNSERRKIAGKQFIDVGIAEQHLIVMASSLAKSGCKPVIITESSFYQRAYDQIVQEMCINKCPVTMLVAFAGIYAHNDNTHIGLYDMALFGNISGLIYLAPTNKQEYLAMLEWSIKQNKYPVAIRIPWNGVNYTNIPVPIDYSNTSYAIKQRGEKIAILALGDFYQLGEKVASLIQTTFGIVPTLINPLYISGRDDVVLNEIKKDHSIVITLEDGIVIGGFGSKITQYYSTTNVKVLNFGFSTNIPIKFNIDEMMEVNHLKPEQIIEEVKKYIN
jgi:1-deoxy-D-xylulose-5-phosphate synthase